MIEPGRVGAIVLAAGAGSRFGGGKLIAPLLDRPVLQHVLDAVAAVRFGEVVCVIPAGPAGQAIEAACRWRGERLVRNPRPERGLSSSVRLGLEALSEGSTAALLVLGDQPLIEPTAMRAVLSAGGERPFTAIRSGPQGPPNPVLVARDAFSLAGELQGDRGFGPLLAARPELVAEVDVPGEDRDVDTAADLAAVAELAWARQVAGNREQVERLREAPDDADFYASTTANFRADPDRQGDEVVAALLALARPDDEWLDVGAGAGRYALPLARKVRRVIAIDPSPAMLTALRESAAEHGIANVRTVEARWPMEGSGDEPIEADVALIAHVSYDIEGIGPFLEGLESAARRSCVAVLMERSPAAAAEPLWPPVHGEPRVPLPGLAAFVGLLRSRGRRPEVRLLSGMTQRALAFDALVAAARRQTWVVPGSAKDAILLLELRRLAVETPDGWFLPQPAPRIGVVTWSPATDLEPSR